jgi:hypothetical protein
MPPRYRLSLTLASAIDKIVSRARPQNWLLVDSGIAVHHRAALVASAFAARNAFRLLVATSIAVSLR